MLYKCYHCKGDHIANEGISDEIFFFRKVHQVEHGLYGVSALLIATYLIEFRLDHIEYGQSLVSRAAWKQFLAEIVPVIVNHESCQVLSNLRVL